MKKVIALLMLVVMLLGLCACGEKSNDGEKSDDVDTSGIYTSTPTRIGLEEAINLAKSYVQEHLFDTNYEFKMGRTQMLTVPYSPIMYESNGGWYTTMDGRFQFNGGTGYNDYEYSVDVKVSYYGEVVFLNSPKFSKKNY